MYAFNILIKVLLIGERFFWFNLNPSNFLKLKASKSNRYQLIVGMDLFDPQRKETKINQFILLYKQNIVIWSYKNKHSEK